jgi:hypothetical protein
MVLDVEGSHAKPIRQVLADGYDAQGVDVNAEQMAVARSVGLNRVHCGGCRDISAEASGKPAAVTGMGVLKHLTKDEVLDTSDGAAQALAARSVKHLAAAPDFRFVSVPLSPLVPHGGIISETELRGRGRVVRY